MATLYITEMPQVGSIGIGFASAPGMPGLVEQSISIGGVSVQSAAFAAGTRLIMVNTDATCSLAFGANPQAVTTAHRMAINETRFYAVNPTQKVAVIANI